MTRPLLCLHMVLAVSPVIAAAQTTVLPPPTTIRSEDFNQASKGFQIGPSGAGSRFRSGEVARQTSVEPRSPGRVTNRTSDSHNEAVDGNVPRAIAVEKRISERLLSATLRAIVFLALVTIAAQLLPKKLAVEVVEGGNTALATILAATAVALGLVLALQ